MPQRQMHAATPPCSAATSRPHGLRALVDICEHRFHRPHRCKERCVERSGIGAAGGAQTQT